MRLFSQSIIMFNNKSSKEQEQHNVFILIYPNILDYVQFFFKELSKGSTINHSTKCTRYSSQHKYI